MKLEEMNTSEFNEAQKHLYHVAMNMKMQEKISLEGIGHFEAAIEALSDNEIPYEESELAIDYLEGMKEKYVEGVGYEAHPLPEYYAIETAIKALHNKNKAITMNCRDLTPYSEKQEQINQRNAAICDALAVYFGDAKDVILNDPVELQKWLGRVAWNCRKVDELARKLEKVEKIVSEWQEDPERDLEAFDSMRELCDIVLDNNQERGAIDEDIER